MKRTALLPLLMFVPGCGVSLWLSPGTETPYIVKPWNEEAFNAVSLDPVRTITLPSGEPINVVSFGNAELLEIKCRQIPVGVATEGFLRGTGSMARLNPQTRKVVETIVERATTEACALDSFRACRWITRNGRSTFSREFDLLWYGGRHVGQVFYIRCMTPAEFGQWALSPTGAEARVREHAEPMLREYLRTLDLQNATKHSVEGAIP